MFADFSPIFSYGFSPYFALVAKRKSERLAILILKID
jgi:hypothetical protein